MAATAKQVVQMQIMTAMDSMTNSHKIHSMVRFRWRFIGRSIGGNPTVEYYSTITLARRICYKCNELDPSPYDFDNDGFEDPTLILYAYYQDDCPVIYGLSNISGMLADVRTKMVTGLQTLKTFPTESTQWNDDDDDGFGDNYGIVLNSTRDPTWPGDGFKEQNKDACPTFGIMQLVT